MFCEKCGSPIQESEMFCSQCGAPVKTASAPEPGPEEAKAGGAGPDMSRVVESVSGAAASALEGARNLTENVAQNEKVRKFFNKRNVIIIIAAVAVLLSGITAAANADNLENFFLKSFSSPEKYYQYVEKKNVESMSKVAAENYETYGNAD